ncbi:hypothetical protein SJ_33 [Proteus phage SJ_PmiM]|nr:hypothetical protein SJ_33 [Proteus phage SJ_PmiM]
MSKFIKSLGRFKFKSPAHIKDYLDDEPYNTSRREFAKFLYKHNLERQVFNINVTEDQSTFWYDLEIVFANGLVFTDEGQEFYIFKVNVNDDNGILKTYNLEFIAVIEDTDQSRSGLNSKEFVINKTISNKSEAKALINELLEYLES